MNDTYKAVFECKALDERKVWYVSNRVEANKHLRYHITARGGRKLSKYRNNDWTFTVRPLFGDTHEVHYDVVNSWGR